MCHSNKYLQKNDSNQLQMCHSNKYLQKYESNPLQMCHSNKYLQTYQSYLMVIHDFGAYPAKFNQNLGK